MGDKRKKWIQFNQDRMKEIIFIIFGFSLAYGNESFCVIESQSSCFQPSCAQPMYDKHVGLPCTCTLENIGASFSKCNEETQTRQLIHFWKPPATCLEGNLPPPIDGIPCDLTCHPGTFLNATAKKCQTCLAGQSSAGTGKIWKEWNEFPGQFQTYCAIGTLGKQCSPWRLLGDSLDSGDNMHADYLDSNLELRVELDLPGTLQFQARVSAEEIFDGLFFIVNDLSHFLGSNREWTNFTYSYPPGNYIFKWQYYKDRSITKGEDRAQIRRIELTGITYGFMKCESCPPGHFSSPESSECQKCPPNTFSNQIESPSCQPCPEGYHSFTGATECTPIVACNATDDFTWYYSPCVNGFHQKNYVWIEPSVCDITYGTLPPPKSEPCSPPSSCPTGMYLHNGICEYCPSGTSSVDGSNTCTTCNIGTAGSRKHIYLKSWDKWPFEFNSQTGCQGACFSENHGGWRLARWFIDSGLGNGMNSESWIEMNTEAYDGASISFNYSMNCIPGNFMLFSVNNLPVQQFLCEKQEINCSYSFETFTHQLKTSKSSEKFKLRWSFKKITPETTSSCDRAIITDMTFENFKSVSGGASTCTECRAGTFSNKPHMSECEFCDIGHYSEKGAHSCQECNDGYFADQKGSAQCLPCSIGTESSPSKSECLFSCTDMIMNEYLKDVDLNVTAFYNLTRLNGKQINIDLEEGVTFYLNFCSWNDFCVNNGEEMNSFICMNDTDSEYNISLGKVISWHNYSGPIIQSEIKRESRRGLTVEFHYGDIWHNNNCSTLVHLKCDPNLDVGTPLISADAVKNLNSSCKLEIIWNTLYACPKCDKYDYSSYETECKNGKKQIVYFWLTTQCHGGITLPSTTEVECEQNITLRSSTAVIIFLVILALFGVILVVLLIIYRKNRKLTIEYKQLKDSTVALDEDDFENLEKRRKEFSQE